MGCGGSKFKVRTGVPGQGQHVLQLAERLGLSRADVNVIYAAFRRFDIDNGASVSIDEFIVVGRLEHSEIVGKMLFRLMDRDYNNRYSPTSGGLKPTTTSYTPSHKLALHRPSNLPLPLTPLPPPQHQSGL